MIPPDRLAMLRMLMQGGAMPPDGGGVPGALPPDVGAGAPVTAAPPPAMGGAPVDLGGAPPDLGAAAAAQGPADASAMGPDVGMGGEPGMGAPPFPSIDPGQWQQMIQALIGGDHAKLAQLQQMQAAQLHGAQQDALAQAIQAIQAQSQAAGAVTADGDVGVPPPLPGPSQATQQVIGAGY